MSVFSSRITSLASRWLGVRETDGDATGTLLRGAGGSFAVNVAGRLLAVGIHIFLARFLGLEGYGIYVTVIAGVNVLYVALNLGLDASAVRFIPGYGATGSYGLIRGFIGFSFLMVLLQSALAALVAVAVVYFTDTSPEMGAALWAAIALLPVRALMQLATSLLRAFKCVVRSLLLSTVIQPLLFAAGVLLAVYIFGAEGSASLALWLNTVSTVLVLIAALVLVARVAPPDIHSAASERSGREWLGVSFPLFLITAFQLILTNTDVLMVGAMAGTTESGIYRAASQVAIMVAFGLNCANMIMAPLISELHTRGERGKLQHLLKVSSRGVLAYSVAVMLVFILFGRFILALFRPEFTAGYNVLIILSAAYLVISLSGPVGFLMTMTGNHREAVWIIGGTAVLNVALNALLITYYGAVGAAIATGTVIALRSIVLSVIVKKRLGVAAHPLAMDKPDGDGG